MISTDKGGTEFAKQIFKQAKRTVLRMSVVGWIEKAIQPHMWIFLRDEVRGDDLIQKRIGSAQAEV